MARKRIGCGCVLFLAAQAAAEMPGVYVFGFRSNGERILIDISTGEGTQQTSSPVAVHGASGQYLAGRINCTWEFVVAGGPGATENKLTGISNAGQVTYSVDLFGRPPGYVIRGMSGNSIILGAVEPGGIDLLGTLQGQVVTVIGPTGRSDIEAIAARGGVIYALGTSDGGTLCALDPATGGATVIGSGTFGSDTTALEFLPSGRLLAAGANLREVDPTTGAATMIGPIGFNDIQALAVVGCYADCNCGGPPPTLNVADFSCFLTKFAAGCS